MASTQHLRPNQPHRYRHGGNKIFIIYLTENARFEMRLFMAEKNSKDPAHILLLPP